MRKWLWPTTLLAVQLADASTTYLNMHNFPWMAEGNRLVVEVIALGWPAFFAMKMLVGLLAILAIHKVFLPWARPAAAFASGLIGLAPAVWNIGLMLYALWIVASDHMVWQ